MKYCGEQGCNNLISKGFYCTQHRRRRNRTKFNHKNKSFYNSAAWKRLTEYVYERDKGCCQRCGKFVFGREAHSHHIIPVKEAPHLKLDPDNITLLCNECHPIVENELLQGKIPSYFQ